MRQCRDNRGVLSRTGEGRETTVQCAKTVGIRSKSHIILRMAYNYDKLYAEQPNALGAPTAAFVAFFETFNQQGARVLDVGCGQGRDALFIGRIGHRVVGVDIAAHGVRDMLAAAEAENLNITGDVADITTYSPSGMFDVVLIDRTLHMLPQNAQRDVLTKLIGHIKPTGWLLIADEASNMQAFRDVLTASDQTWTICKDGKGYLFAKLGNL
jgi:2-polyprenyl-3-methyl-5-hydroxy-6-metoxy-1,4-benzoquinol methylase